MIPKISLENLKLSKIVCGTNQFNGMTHRDDINEMRILSQRFAKAETIAKYMIHLFQNHGINCCVSSPRQKILEAIRIVEKEIGEKYHWLCTPSRRKTIKNLRQDIYKQIDWCAEKGVSVCMPHRDYTDNAILREKLIIGSKDRKSKKFPHYPKISVYIRDKGMIPGLSTHFLESIRAVEKQDYDVSLITQPLNKIGFESNTEPTKLIQVIQNTKTQILNIKPMAAGRIKPRIGLEFCLKNIKKNDFMAIGFDTFEQCKETGNLVEEILTS